MPRYTQTQILVDGVGVVRNTVSSILANGSVCIIQAQIAGQILLKITGVYLVYLKTIKVR